MVLNIYSFTLLAIICFIGFKPFVIFTLRSDQTFHNSQLSKTQIPPIDEFEDSRIVKKFNWYRSAYNAYVDLIQKMLVAPGAKFVLFYALDSFII